MRLASGYSANHMLLTGRCQQKEFILAAEKALSVYPYLYRSYIGLLGA